MKFTFLLKFIQIAFWGIVASWQVSCVTFRGDFPEHMPAPGPVSQKISINFSNETLSHVNNSYIPSSSEKPVVEGYMLANSGLFLTTQSLSGEEDLHFRFYTVHDGEQDEVATKVIRGLYFGLSMLSLTLIPYYEKDYRRLKVEVIRHGKILKSYFYESGNVLLSWLFVLPFWRPSEHGDFWSERTEKKHVLDQYLVSRFLLDFYRDFMPKPQPAVRR